LQSQGQSSPSAGDIAAAAQGMRIEAGDPATVAEVAQQIGWPHVRINASRYRGESANEQDEWVEVRNLGGAAQDMTGWSVRLDGSSTRWTFQEGFSLQPGQACKFYTGAPMADPCPGTSNVSSSGVLPNDAGTLTLWVDGLNFKAIEARYAADPTKQPPPPNLQGFE